MIEDKKYIRDFHSPFEPKSPSPRKPIDKRTYQQGHNDGWNACMAHLKAAGKI